MRPTRVLAAVLLAQALAVATAALSETYRDARTGLVIHYPRGWRLDNSYPGFEIVDFPPSKRPPQVLVPADHADIGIFSPPEGENTVAEWMGKERVGESQGYRVTELALGTKHIGTLRVTKAVNHPSGIPGATLLLYFFDVDGRPIKAALFYRGQGRGAEFEGVVNSIIAALEPISSH